MRHPETKTKRTTAADPRPASPVEIPADGAWSRVVEPGTVVSLRAGKAWLTFENEGEDHVLEAPAAFVAPHHGRVALWAFTPVALAVEPPVGHKLAA